jgi:alginate O-acetyltransferase complex protein AlgI
MFFNSSLFIICFLSFFGIYHSREWQKNTRIFLVLVASLLFYALCDYYYLPLLLGVIAIHFYAGNYKRQHRLLVFCSVILLDILILAYFKFIKEDIKYPLGLSFYIFQCLSWLFDIRSGRTKPDLSAIEFASSVTYFPHLPAGPILKNDTLRNTFQSLISWEDCKSGILYFSLGITKKTVADLLAPVTDAYLLNGAENWLEAWTGGIAGLARIYGDFSGYTDMAMGISILLGFRLPINFYRPFTATTVTNYFSERWHITLAQWIREYLFLPISLRFSRMGIPVEIGVLVSFLIMSLWHGSNFTFLVWGLYIGILIIIEDRVKFKAGYIGIIRTNLLVMLGLVIFYSSSLKSSFTTFQAFFVFEEITSRSIQTEFIMTLLGFMSLILISFLDHNNLPKISRSKFYWLLTFAFFLFSFLLGTSNRSFIYFDF